MSKVPLIPSIRPEPQVFRTRAEAKKREAEAAAAKKESNMTETAKLVAHNVEDESEKPEAVMRVWAILSKMDPTGELFVNNVGLMLLAGKLLDEKGKLVKGRSAEELGLTKEEIEFVRPWGIFDSPEPDDAEQATGVILTAYQLVELAFEAGRQYESGEVTRSLVSVVVGDDDDDDDWDDEDDEDDEGFDDDGDPIEVITEDADYDPDDDEDD